MKRALIIVVIVVAVGIFAGLLRYPGLSAAMWYQFLDSDLVEARNQFLCLDYWSRYLGELEADPQTGFFELGDERPSESDFEHGIHAFHAGDFRRAVDLVEESIAARGESEERLFWLGMSYLRLAEAENCLEALLPSGSASHEEGAESAVSALGHSAGDHQRLCTLPLVRHHQRGRSSRQAGAAFRRLAELDNRDRGLYRWLLNFSHMTLGTFPDGVEKALRVDGPFIDTFHQPAVASDLLFEDRAAELGVDTFDAGKGVAVEDFDGDGDLDLVTGGSFGTLRFYRNEAGESFVDRTTVAALDGILQPHMVSAADYDDDGWMDLFVGSLFHPFRLLRNRGDGTFRDVTEAAGLAVAAGEPAPILTWTSAWGDVDSDGDLDLFIAQWGARVPFVKGLLAGPKMDSRLYLNREGHFVDVTAEFGLAGLTRDRNFIGAAFGDWDNDGYPDLFLSSPMHRASALLRNREGRGFELLERQPAGFVAAFVDVDHDGQLEIFQGGLADARTATAKAVYQKQFGAARSSRSSILTAGAGGGLTPLAGYFADLPISIMGASWGDLDNDGCHDFYLGTGGPEAWFILPNLMYRGELEGRRCAPRAANISSVAGFGTIQKGHGIVFFDFDDDGDQDIYSSLGGMWPADRWPNQLFVNLSEDPGSWLKLRLRGATSNSHGVGTRIRVIGENGSGLELERRDLIDNKTGFGSAPYLAHLGLLDAEGAVEVEVWWPASGCRRSVRGEVGQLLVLEEGECGSEA